MQVVLVSVCVCECVSPLRTPPPPSAALSGKSNQSAHAAVPPHLSALIRRWGDNWEGMIVKEIMGDSITPRQELLWAGVSDPLPR